VCAWDGATYIIDPHRNVVCFEFGRRVCAFAAGGYALSGARACARPALAYATFDGEVVIFHDVTMPAVRATTLIERVGSARARRGKRRHGRRHGKDHDAGTAGVLLRNLLYIYIIL
jgi:hypothetical protein